MLSYEPTYWNTSLFPAQVDVAIIGGGISGLSTAIALKKAQPTLSILILEKENLGAVATTANAGFLCLGSPSEILSELEQFGETHLYRSLRLKWNGIHRLLSYVGGKKIQLKKSGGYESFPEVLSDRYDKVIKNLDQLNIILERVTKIPQFYSIEADTKRVYGWESPMKRHVSIAYEGQLHSGLLHEALELKCLNLGVRIRKSTCLLGFEEKSDFVELHTEEKSFKAKHLMLCTNGLTPSLLPDCGISPGRGQVFITQPIPGFGLRSNVHVDEGYIYFRNLGPDRLLLGGGRNIDFDSENTAIREPNLKILQFLKEFAENNIVGQPIEIEQSWSGIMGFTQSKEVIIESKSDKIHLAAGLNGMGVAMGAEVGNRAAQLIVGKNQRRSK